MYLTIDTLPQMHTKDYIYSFSLFSIKNSAIARAPQNESDTHTEWNPEIMWKYSFSFNFKSQIRLFKERRVHFSSCFVWLTSWLNKLLQFRKNSPFVFVNVLTTNQTCFRNWFDFNRRKKNTQRENIANNSKTRTYVQRSMLYGSNQDFLVLLPNCVCNLLLAIAFYLFGKWWANAKTRFSRISANNPIFIVSKLLMQIPR